MILKGEVMTKEEYNKMPVKMPIEPHGIEAVNIGNDWHNQSQRNPEFNIKLAKERIKQDREFGASYYGGEL